MTAVASLPVRDDSVLLLLAAASAAAAVSRSAAPLEFFTSPPRACTRRARTPHQQRQHRVGTRIRLRLPRFPPPALAGLPSPLKATRYHSLAAAEATLPACMEVTCRTATGMIQGVRHRRFTIEGVQFHPESILTEHGKEMFANFLRVRGGEWQ